MPCIMHQAGILALRGPFLLWNLGVSLVLSSAAMLGYVLRTVLRFALLLH